MLVPEGGGEAVRTVVTAGPTQAQIVQYNIDLALWNEVNSQAKSLIYTMCEDGAREAVEDERYAVRIRIPGNGSQLSQGTRMLEKHDDVNFSNSWTI